MYTMADAMNAISHSGLEDCGILSSMGGMTVLEPGDPWMIAKMLGAALELKKPVYIRLGLEASQPIYDLDQVNYEIGKAIIAREGNDGAFIASGCCVKRAIEAAEIIEEECGAQPS